MTRLDATSEPSMEDILASIRKIIAEDPPGSRPVPTPSASAGALAQPASPQPSSRAPERDRFSSFGIRGNDTAASTPQPSLVAPEPYLKASPQKSAVPEFGSEPFFSSTPATSSSSFTPVNAAPSRIEPSFGPMSNTLSPQSQPAPEIAAPVAQTDGASVDAQLSDLLGETASVVIQSVSDVSPSSAPVAAASAAAGSVGFGNLMAGRSAQSSPTQPTQLTPSAEVTTSESKPQDTRPGFTVSRDGFVSTVDDVASSAEADPFEFDLGPSPFQTNSESQIAAPAPAPVGNSLTARMSASSLERIAVPSVAATVPSGSIIENKTDTAKVADTAADFVPDTATPVVVADGGLLAEVATPSVAATLAPKSFETSRPSEPVGRFIPANASVETPKPVDRDVLEVVAPQRTSRDAPIEVVRVAPEADAQTQSPPSSSSTAVAVHHADGQMRTMEDTVAELLRPMLKTWLAENMPRIVERALRRELSEQMLLGKKDAAE